MTDKKAAPWLDGLDARRGGKPITALPDGLGPDDEREWQRGWFYGDTLARQDSQKVGAVMPPKSARDRQVGGDHYKGRKMQVWDIWEAFPELTKWEACAIKYILRHKDGQDRKQELRKAIHYLEYEVERHGQ